MKPGDTVFVTKYALSTGIVRTTVMDISDRYISDRYITVAWKDGLNGRATFHEADVHVGLPEARTKRKSMAKARIAALTKQIARLKKIASED